MNYNNEDKIYIEQVAGRLSIDLFDCGCDLEKEKTAIHKIDMTVHDLLNDFISKRIECRKCVNNPTDGLTLSTERDAIRKALEKRVTGIQNGSIKPDGWKDY